MTASRIPITKPLFGPEELAAVQEPLRSGWVVQGPQVERFEAAFAKFTGAPHAAATSNCTTALHVAVAALGLQPGDEVVVPAFTWVATANVVQAMGAKPVFCDVDLATFNIDPAQAQACLTERTVGLLPVHLFGLCADMDPLLRLARERGLWVVEDAACAFGAWYRGRHAGTLGDAGAFSFHPRKSITTGEGGMLTAARPELDALARSLRDHGASRSDHARHGAQAAFLLPDFDVLGYNYRMTDLQAALGNAQMARAPEVLHAREQRARRYGDLLAGLDWLRPPAVPRGMVHGWQAYVALYAPEEPALPRLDALRRRRDALMAALEARGVATRQGTHAPPLAGFYRRAYGHRPEEFPRAALAEGLSLALPLYPQMTDEEQDTVVAELRRAGGA